MKNALKTLRLIGFILFICHSMWPEVLYWPGLAIVGLTSLALLYYWRTNTKGDNIFSVSVIVICVLILFGL